MEVSMRLCVRMYVQVLAWGDVEGPVILGPQHCTSNAQKSWEISMHGEIVLR